METTNPHETLVPDEIIEASTAHHLGNPLVIGQLDRRTRWAATAFLVVLAICATVAAAVVAVSVAFVAAILFVVGLAARAAVALTKGTNR